MMRAWIDKLRAPVDIASLVYYRIVFGLILLWEVWRYFERGWINSIWIDPKFHFSYTGFSWVKVWPGDGMFLHMGCLGILAFFVVIGLFYRLSVILFFLGFTYAFLLERSVYLNHFYFVSLVTFLLIFVPAHRAFSVDALFRKKLRSSTAPAWALWALRGQIAVVYFFGGVAKLNSDWLHGEPVRIWLERRSDFPFIGPLLTQEWLVWFVAYGGLFFDLFIVFLLLWRPTRVAAFCMVLFFHFSNAILFNIGIFPWFSIATTALFFRPDWPRLALVKLDQLMGVEDEGEDELELDDEEREADREVVAPEREPQPAAGPAPVVPPPRGGERVVLWILGLHFTLQCLLPLRHFLYPGNVSWTEEGHNFAWHMKLRDKQGVAKFTVIEKETGEEWEVDLFKYLTTHQRARVATRPEMALEFARYIAEEIVTTGSESVEVRVWSKVSLNGRKPRLLLDPEVNLAAERITIAPYRWILPLDEPLRWEDDQDSAP